MVYTHMKIVLFLLLSAWHFSVGAVEEAIQSHDSITTAVKAFLQHQVEADSSDVEISVGKLDPRLRLRLCSTDLSTAFPPASRKAGNVTVGVRCEGDKPWSLYVQAQLKLFGDVVVALRTLSRNELVGNADVILKRLSLDGVVGGYFRRVADVIGMRVVRTVRNGKIVSSSSLTLPVLIKKGDRVTIVARSSGIEVKMDGKALSSGAKGDQIRIINNSSKKEVEGIVIGVGSVEVGM
jgi:flagellar basal body P-ring formation protein FlgA